MTRSNSEVDPPLSLIGKIYEIFGESDSKSLTNSFVAVPPEIMEILLPVTALVNVLAGAALAVAVALGVVVAVVPGETEVAEIDVVVCSISV